MKKIKGIPSKPGIYLFNWALDRSDLQYNLLLYITNNGKYIYGKGGSFPISSLEESVIKNTSYYCPIIKPKSWESFSKFVKYKNSKFAWIKNDSHFMGVAIINVIDTSIIYASSIIWINNPNINVSCGSLSLDEEYFFKKII